MNIRHRFWGLLPVFFVIVLFFACTPSFAKELQITVSYQRDAQTPVAVVWLSIAPEYHAYAHKAGSAGKPTNIRLSPYTVTANKKPQYAAVYYPQGSKQKDVFSPAEDVYVYEGKVPLFVKLTGIAEQTTLQGDVDALLCSAKHCLPVTQRLSITVPKASDLPVMDKETLKAWKAAKEGTVVPAPDTVSGGMSGNAVPFAMRTQDGHNVGLAGDDGSSIQAFPPKIDDKTWRLHPRPLQEELEVRSLGKALLLGLLAGLLLNCMPCVLPVLTLKASAMLVVGDGDNTLRIRRFREHNILFAAGIMTQFFVLALLLGAAGLIWGQLFQSAALVTTMLIVVFLLGLSMLGLFTLPVIDLKAGSSRSPRLNAYLTGIMATLLATPCSGPLLGGVLSWAFTQPLVILVLVFLAVGVGMSIPYLVFALRPALAAFLPRPGAWMGILERLVGFFLLGTSLYLLSILPQDRHLPLLAALLVVAVGGWIWGRFGGYDAPPLRRRILGIGLIILTCTVVLYASRPPAPLVRWQAFEATEVRALLGKKPLLVEFTADWCPNCKFLEQTVLTQERLRAWQEKYGLQLVRVDLTRKNAAAEAFLGALDSSSIPLTALFPTGLMASAPIVLRDIYSVATLEQAMRKAFGPGVTTQP